MISNEFLMFFFKLRIILFISHNKNKFSLKKIQEQSFGLGDRKMIKLVENHKELKLIKNNLHISGLIHSVERGIIK